MNDWINKDKQYYLDMKVFLDTHKHADIRVCDKDGKLLGVFYTYWPTQTEKEKAQYTEALRGLGAAGFFDQDKGLREWLEEK